MKNVLLFFAIFLMFAFPKASFGQAPTLGSTSGFALFTGAGAFDNAGASVITGNVGSFTYTIQGFPIPGTVVGTIYSVGDPVLTSAKADAGVAFGSYGANGSVLGTPFETFNTTGYIYAGTYHTVGAAALNGDFTLDAQGDPNAIFVININGALTVGAGFHILLINSASLCNVYWLIKGDFTLGAGSVFRGTIVSDGFITLLEGSSLLGRGITTSGAISLSNNVVTSGGSASASTITAGGPTAICADGSVILSGNVGGVWSNGATTPSITANKAGDYFVTNTGACGSVTSNKISVTVNPSPVANAGADRAICLNSDTQIGAPAVTGSTYSWTSVPAGFTSTVSNPTVTPLVTTTYTVVETNPAIVCTNSNSVVVTISAAPAAVAGANSNICINSSTQIGATTVAGSTYSWSSIPAGFTSTVSNPTVSPLVNTTYTVVQTITASGCTNSNSIVVTVNPIPAAIAGADRAVCANTTTTLGTAAVTGSTYIWSSVPAGFTSTEANPTAIPQVTTTYTVIQTITATGCTNKNNVVVTVKPITAAVAGADRIICRNESTQIGAAVVAGSTYSWTSVPAGFNSTEANPTVTPMVSTTYTVIETNPTNACSNKNSVIVTIKPISAAIAGADRVICQNTSTQIGAAAVAGSIYSWTSVPAGFTSPLANPNVSPLAATTYTVVETTVAGCTNKNSVVVTLNPAPAAIAGADRTICINTNTQIGSTAVAGNTYNWTSAPAGFNSTVANPTVNPEVTTTYILVETNTITSCTNSNSVIITVTKAPTAIAGSNRTICLKEATTLGAIAVSGSTYSWTSVPAGFTSSVANPTVNPMVNTTYTVVETNAAEVCQNSNSVTVTIGAAPIIVTEPADQTTCVGNPVSFTVTATGTGLTYQWRRGTLALINGGNISGATSSTLTINPVNTSDVASDYNVVISGACSVTMTSNNASLEANPAPSISTSVCVGSQVSFSASAIGAGTTYQWRKGDVNLSNGSNITGATSSTLTINPVTEVDASPNYNVVIGGTCSVNANSLHVALVVNSATSILTEPVNQTACAGTAAVFSVGATGSNLTYQWRKGTVNLVNGGNISGATSSTMTIDPVSASDVASNYNVVVTGTSCSPVSTSKDAALALCIPTGTTSLAAGTTLTAVTIYPNPFKSSIDIKINDATQVNNIELKIYNILGEEVIDTNLTKQITTIGTSNLPSGIYLYKVNSNNKTIQSGKLVSQK